MQALPEKSPPPTRGSDIARIQNLLNHLLIEIDGSAGILVAVDYVDGKTGPDCYIQFADGKNLAAGLLGLQAKILKVGGSISEKILADMKIG